MWPPVALRRLKLWGINLPSLEAGVETGVYFFPDTCEIAVYSIKAGVVKALDPNGGKPVISWEGGVQAALSAQVELAVLNGPGPASAASFAGNFYTVQGGIGPVGHRAMQARQAQGTWYGGTVGVGVGPSKLAIQAGSVVWNYQLMTTVNLDDHTGGHCICMSLLYNMP